MTDEAWVSVPQAQLNALLAGLDAANREMTGTARLLGRQHEAIVGMSDALRQIIETDMNDGPLIYALALAALAEWGTEQKEAA